jgi:hypothetical protein
MGNRHLGAVTPIRRRFLVYAHREHSYSERPREPLFEAILRRGCNRRRRRPPPRRRQRLMAKPNEERRTLVPEALLGM